MSWWKRRRKYGKLHKIVYTSVIYALGSMGVEINKDLLYERIEREF